MTMHMTGTRKEWLAARLELLDAEKELTRRSEVARRRMMHIICYLRQRSNVFETYWTTRRGVEAMDNSYRLLD